MRIPIWLTLVTAIVVLGVVVIVGQALIMPDLPLITAAEFSLETITPNADGDSDVTTFSYSISANALVSLVLENQEGQQFIFRDSERRTPGDYRVDFSGVVGGYILPGETVAGDVLRRLIPNGQYTWRLVAVNTATSKRDERSGMLIVADADSPLPEITTFSVAPDVFTPNQDGIRDRTTINVYLSKASDLTVYLEGPDGVQIYVTERKEGRQPGEPGRHDFDYEGGVDLGADPPPDGTYIVVARAQDAVGQVIERRGTLTIQQGGKPLGEIIPQAIGVDVVFDTRPYNDRYYYTAGKPGEIITPPDNPAALSLSTVTMPLGDMLVFKLTVENYSEVPLRTSGPPPGTVYQQDQRDAALGWFQESGAWRVGIMCETSKSDFPWRWAIGTSEDLVSVEDPATGNTYYYLPPGRRAVVWGGIRMTELVEQRNPQNCWAGLIHEDVEISIYNNNVGTREIELVALPADSTN